MDRSKRWRRRPRLVSRRRAASSLPVRNLSSVIAVPDSTGNLSDGVVVEADVSARLLGLKVLRLRADVVLMPARLRGPGVVPVSSRPVQAGGAVDAEGGVAWPSSANGTGDIAEAIRLLDESGKTLDRVRNDARFR